MSSTAIISAIITLLVLLVAYAFISQTMERRRKQRQRLQKALTRRINDFKFLVQGFPPGFLPKELHTLVYRCLLDALDQAIALEPKNQVLIEELALYSKQLEEISRSPKVKRTPLNDPHQVKEIKELLQGLNSFIAQQHSRGHLSNQQHKQYNDQIKRLVIQISVDSYVVNAKQALSSGKGRLAIHYYSLAKKLLARDSGRENYQKQIQQLNTIIEKLEVKVKETGSSGSTSQQTEASRQQASSEWDKFDQEASWKKKKSLYD